MFRSKNKKLLQYYEQCLPIAENINYKDVSTSLSQQIEELLHNESNRLSEWKNLIGKLRIARPKRRQDIDGIAKIKDDSAVFIEFTTGYLKDSKATLGNVLKLLMCSKRIDILLKIKNQVHKIINEHTNRTEDISNLPKEDINIPEEEEIVESVSESDTINEMSSYESTSSANESIASTSYYSEQNAQNSLLNRETSKQTSVCNFNIFNSDKLAGYETETDDAYSECSEDQPNIYLQILKDDLKSCDQKAENENKYKRKSKKMLEKKLKEISNSYSKETYYDGTSCEESNYSYWPSFKLTESSDNCKDSDDDSVDHEGVHSDWLIEKCNSQDIPVNKKLQTVHQCCSENQSLETNINKQNKHNEKIEEVCTKDRVIRSLQEYENQNLNLAQNNLSFNTITKFESALSHFTDYVFPASINQPENLKILISHSDKNNDIAFGLSKSLIERNFRAIAMGQLNFVWNRDFVNLLREAVDWADVVIPLITNEWLQEIENIDEIEESIINSCNTKYVFRLLQTNYVNTGSTNLHLVPVVMQGTCMKFCLHPELRIAKVLWREYDSLCSLISLFHKSTKNERKVHREFLLNSRV